MCGVAGILNLRPGPPPAVDALACMAAAQRHRGPDGAGISTAQVERVYRDIEAKRRATSHLHSPPLLVDPQR